MFDEDAYPEMVDVFLVDDLDLALIVERVQTNTDLKGRFHHYEIRCGENELSIAALEAQIV